MTKGNLNLEIFKRYVEKQVLRTEQKRDLVIWKIELKLLSVEKSSERKGSKP